MNDEGLADT